MPKKIFAEGIVTCTFVTIVFLHLVDTDVLRIRPTLSLVLIALVDAFFFSLQLVELKNGETYNGHLVSCDNWMNINLREVICTSRVSSFVIATVPLKSKSTVSTRNVIKLIF